MFYNGRTLIITIVISLVIGSPAGATSGVQSNKQSKVDSLCTEALLLSSHGRFDESNAIINSILNDYKLTRKGRAAMYGIISQNGWLAGDYALCYEALSKSLSRKQLRSMKFQRTLSCLPRESMERPEGEMTIDFMVDSLFYEERFLGCEIKLPVNIGGKEERIIFDNGCAIFSMACESFASEHGIRPIGAEGTASGVAASVPMWIGIADSLSIGKLIFRNILFTVVPDESLQNPVTRIDAALGANIFRLIGEMHFDNEARTITLPANSAPMDPNVIIDSGGLHYVCAEIDGKVLSLQLDLGSSSTSLNSNYFKANESAVRQGWSERRSHEGGVGGFRETDKYSLAEISIRTCGGDFVKKDIEVSVTAASNENEGSGILGADCFLSFKKAVLDLRYMYLYFE